MPKHKLNKVYPLSGRDPIEMPKVGVGNVVNEKVPKQQKKRVVSKGFQTKVTWMTTFKKQVFSPVRFISTESLRKKYSESRVTSPLSVLVRSIARALGFEVPRPMKI